MVFIIIKANWLIDGVIIVPQKHFCQDNPDVVEYMGTHINKLYES